MIELGHYQTDHQSREIRHSSFNFGNHHWTVKPANSYSVVAGSAKQWDIKFFDLVQEALGNIRENT